MLRKIFQSGFKGRRGMLKLIGAILIFSGTLAWGVKGAADIKRHVKALSGLVSLIEIMKNEICERRTPVPQLLDILYTSTESPVKEFIGRVKPGMKELGKCSFASIWKRAVEESGEMQLTPHERQVVCQLGFSIGHYSAAEQESAMLLAQRRLEMFLHKAEEVSEQNARVRTFLGLTAGIFAVIILL